MADTLCLDQLHTDGHLQTTLPTPQKSYPKLWRIFSKSPIVRPSIPLCGVKGESPKIFVLGISPNQAILSTFNYFQTKSGGGVKISKYFSDQFSFFHFIQIFFYCGHYFCLPSAKIVVTMFACHLHNSSGMCLHLARTNMS